MRHRYLDDLPMQSTKHGFVCRILNTPNDRKNDAPYWQGQFQSVQVQQSHHLEYSLNIRTQTPLKSVNGTVKACSGQFNHTIPDTHSMSDVSQDLKPERLQLECVARIIYYNPLIYNSALYNRQTEHICKRQDTSAHTFPLNWTLHRHSVRQTSNEQTTQPFVPLQVRSPRRRHSEPRLSRDVRSAARTVFARTH